MTSQPPSEFPQTFFRGRVTPDGKPTLEQRVVHDEAERTRALAEGWGHDKRTAGESAQLMMLAHQEQEHRDHQTASRRRGELLELALTKLLNEAQESAAPQPVTPVMLRSPATIQQKAPKQGLGEVDVLARSQRRHSVIDPLLEKKGWSVPQWALRAGVSAWVPREYLKGKTDPHESTATALAQALGLDQLPELPQ